MKALTEATAKLFAPIPLESRDRLHLALSKEGNTFIAIIKATEDEHGFRRTPSVFAQREFVQRIPERRQLDNPNLFVEKWEFAATDITCAIIHAVWPKEHVTFDDESRILYNYQLLTLTQQTRNAEVHASYKATKAVPAHSLELVEDPELKLAPYQQVATVLSSESEGFGLFMEQGAGKTPCIITQINTAARDFKEKRMYRAIIVCPNAVRMNWANEFRRFSTQKGKVTILRGGELARTKALIDALTVSDGEKFTVVIVSYGTLVPMIGVLKQIEWDLASIDEAHLIKWPETKRCKAALELRDAARARYPLTGTPVCNTPLDLYALFEFMGKGFSGFNSWKAFRSFYGTFDSSDGESKLVGVQNLPFLKERLARLSFIINKKEALPDLPEKLYSIIEVEMTKDQQDAYDNVARHLALEIESDLAESDNKSMTINNVLTKLLRLAQITSGFITWDKVVDDDGAVLQPKRVEGFKANPKIDALIEDYRTLQPDEKVIIWACWVPDIEAISARLTAEGIKHVCYYGGVSDKGRTEAERAFNEDPDCRVLVGNPQAGGAGLNLIGYPPGRADEYETDLTTEYYFSQGWSPVLRSQSEDRGHRRGTRRPVNIKDLCVPDTIDETIRERVLQKRITAYEIADIRDILATVLRGFFHA